MSRSVDGVTNLPRINPMAIDLDSFYLVTYYGNSGHSSPLVLFTDDAFCNVDFYEMSRKLLKRANFVYLGSPSQTSKLTSAQMIPKECFVNNALGSDGIQVETNDGTNNYLTVKYSSGGISNYNTSSAGSISAAVVLYGDFFSPDRQNDLLCKEMLTGLLDEPDLFSVYYTAVADDANLAPSRLVNGKVVTDAVYGTLWNSYSAVYNCAVGIAGNLIDGHTYTFGCAVDSYAVQNATAELVLTEISNNGSTLDCTQCCSLGLSSTSSDTFVAHKGCNYVAYIVVKSTVEVVNKVPAITVSYVGTIDPRITG